MPTITKLLRNINNMQNHTILLVDASGSMSSFEKETRKSIYSIIKELNKDTHFTLVFFDDYEYKIAANDWCSNISPTIGYTYKSRGCTPITDALYKAVQDITNSVTDLEHLSENHKLIVFTDGYENASKYVKSEDLGRAIEHFTDNFKWNFQFIGPKSQETGIRQYTDSIKIQKENVMLYASMTEGLEKMKQTTVSK